MASDNITILDIAREAGVSPATVSRVMSGHPNVSAKTYDKVKAVIDKYNFSPNSLARGLLQKNTYTVGILTPQVAQPYYADVIAAAQQVAAQQGYGVQLYRLALAPQMLEALAEQIIQRRLDGVLLLGNIEEGARPHETARALSRLREYMPMVSLAPPLAGLACISIYVNLAAGMRDAVRHLHALGHTRVAYLGTTPQSRGLREQERGFFDEMDRLGLTPLAQAEGTHTPAMGEMATLKLLSGLSKGAWPTALISANDLMALGAIKQLRGMGLRLPQDMAVVGCDNQFFTEYTQPQLTTIDLGAAEHGAIAMRQLLEAKENEAALAFTQVREPSLVVRESCGAKLGRRGFPV